VKAPVAVAIVSWNSAADLEANLDTVLALDPAPREIVVVDNHSRDASVMVARGLLGEAGLVVELDHNSGWAGGMNRAIAATSAPWILALNPDARPAKDYLACLLACADQPRWRVGAVTGRLLRPGSPPRLDACGMRLTRSFRHLDRGSGEPDRGQYGVPERVFGATGAASLFSRAALDDVAIGSEEWIDEAFHSYREDAELAFRLRERRWEILYTPEARCEHRRAVTPSGRRQVDPAINRASLRNRYLLRLAHQSGRNLWRTLPQTLSRDLLALLWVLVAERSSRGAYQELWRRRRELWQRAQRIRARRQVSIDEWFGIQGLPL
jgi:GT2 family glycosyltransferase